MRPVSAAASVALVALMLILHFILPPRIWSKARRIPCALTATHQVPEAQYGRDDDPKPIARQNTHDNSLLFVEFSTQATSTCACSPGNSRYESPGPPRSHVCASASSPLAPSSK